MGLSLTRPAQRSLARWSTSLGAAIRSRRRPRTTQAPFIEEVQSRGELYIHQPYELYSEENHEAWRKLYSRVQPRWERYANENFMEGIQALRLDPDHVPRLDRAGLRRRIETASERYGLAVANVFHAGDGNLHPLILFDGRYPEQVDKIFGMSEEIMTQLIA